tara:strand:+ start:191 stop:955 length:765 start_codon:yes stop_codon:yes gene_type:complete
VKKSIIEAIQKYEKLSDVANFLDLSYKQLEGKMSKYKIKFRSVKILQRKREGKFCSKCKSKKKLRSFYNAKYESIDGKTSWCKVCTLKQQSEYRKTEVVKKKIIKRTKLYREKIKKENPKKFINYQRLWRNTAKGMYQNMKKASKVRKKIKFSMDYKTFANWYNKQQKKCIYCDISLDKFLEIKEYLPVKTPKNYYKLTIDRKDSNIDYEIDNICIACGFCNYIKGYIFNFQEFKIISKEYIRPLISNLEKNYG